MEVWKIIFLSKLVICRFHVNLPGCKTNATKKIPWIFSTNPRHIKKHAAHCQGRHLSVKSKLSITKNDRENLEKIPLVYRDPYNGSLKSFKIPKKLGRMS